MMKKYIVSAMVLAMAGTFSFFLISGKQKTESSVNNTPSGTLHVPSLPSKLDFAGEEVPLKEYDVVERLEKEILVNTFWHSNTIVLLKKSNRYFPVIEPILKKNGVPDDFKYLCMIESGLANVVSPSNAAGFWQFLESTGKRYGLEINDQVDERYDLVKATEAACRYLTDNKNKLGSWTLAAAAYNMGENGVMKQLAAQGVDTYFDLHLNNETSRYVFRILAAKEIHRKMEHYGFSIPTEQMYQPVATRSVSVDSTVKNWPEFALTQGSNYKHLKLLNPWIRERQLTNKTRKTYSVLLPAESKPGKMTNTLPEGAE